MFFNMDNSNTLPIRVAYNNKNTQMEKLELR